MQKFYGLDLNDRVLHSSSRLGQFVPFPSGGKYSQNQAHCTDDRGPRNFEMKWAGPDGIIPFGVMLLANESEQEALTAMDMCNLPKRSTGSKLQ